MQNVVRLGVATGPRASTPELRAALRKASIKAVQDRLAEHSRISTKTWIYIGKELIGTKENADNDGPKVFASLFAKNKEQRDEAHYPFSLATGRMLMSIASSGINNVNSEKLPSAWGTLYHLSRIMPERLSNLIESGAVHPMMTRAEAAKLAGRKKKPSKKAEKKAAKEGGAYETAMVLFRRIREPRKRAIEFLHLMHDCGISLKELAELEER